MPIRVFVPTFKRSGSRQSTSAPAAEFQRPPNRSWAAWVCRVALVYGALPGFTVVAWEQFSSAEGNVSSELSTLATMYRQTVTLPAAEQTKMRELPRDYTTAVPAEWGRQGSDAASAAITDMDRVLGVQQSPTDGSNAIKAEVRGQLNVLTSHRNTRVLDAKAPDTRIALGWTAIRRRPTHRFSRLLRLENTRVHMTLAGAIAVLLGLLLFITFWLDHPFGRQLGVTPTYFDYTVRVFDGVDKET